VGWYSVRCVFQWSAGVYEERILLWEAGDFDEAIELAESEAREYAHGIIGGRYLGLAQSFEIGHTRPNGGDELYSLVRTSELDVENYVSRFFDSGGEHTQ